MSNTIPKFQKDQDTARDMMIRHVLESDKSIREGNVCAPFVLHGFAGTGKTQTLGEACSMIERLGFTITLATPTHRAAQVLQARAKREVNTIHSLMFKPMKKRKAGHNVFVAAKIDNPGKFSGAKLYDGKSGSTYAKIHGYTIDTDARPSSEWYHDSLRKATNYIKRKKLDATIVFDCEYEETTFVPRDIQEVNEKLAGSVLIIDEISMVAEDIQKFIARLAVPTIFVGDPAQLPPIYQDQEEHSHISDIADFTLTEVVRSDEESGIPQVGMDIRNKQPIQAEYGNGVRRFVVKSQFMEWGIKGVTIQNIFEHSVKKCTPEEFNETTFLLYTNKNVDLMNSLIRTHQGRGDIPECGERLIALNRFESAGIVKNEILTIKEVHEDSIVYNKKSGLPYIIDVEVIRENGEAVTIPVTLLAEAQKAAGIKSAAKKTLGVNYAYAMTVHRSQGSSFPRVVWVNDTNKFAQGILRKLAYTAVTRAEKLLDIYTWSLEQAEARRYEA